ncbi:MAG: flavoprotein [Verrucomicrobiales bacterium]
MSTTSDPSDPSPKSVVLGVSGSIAAYKAAELTSLLRREGGLSVFPVLTENGSKFITPLTLQTLAREPVIVDLWEEGQGWQPGHIELADQASLLILAPATAHLIAQLAHGLAPDALTSIYLAYRGPVLIAPAMNGHMWQHPATQSNVAILRDRGHHFIGPEDGMQACGYSGEGRLWPVNGIFRRAMELLGHPIV